MVHGDGGKDTLSDRGEEKCVWAHRRDGVMGGEEATTAAPPIAPVLRTKHTCARQLTGCLVFKAPKLDFRPGFYDRRHSLLKQPWLLSCHKNVINWWRELLQRGTGGTGGTGGLGVTCSKRSGCKSLAVAVKFKSSRTLPQPDSRSWACPAAVAMGTNTEKKSLCCVRWFTSVGL